MAEQLDLTAAIVPSSRINYKINRMVLDWNAQVIQIYLIGSDGAEVMAEYNGATATALLTILNTSNLSTTSLQKRVLQKLVVDGKIPAGNVTGVAS